MVDILILSDDFSHFKCSKFMVIISFQQKRSSLPW